MGRQQTKRQFLAEFHNAPDCSAPVRTTAEVRCEGCLTLRQGDCYRLEDGTYWCRECLRESMAPNKFKRFR